MPTNTLTVDKDHLAGFYEQHPNWYTSVLRDAPCSPLVLLAR